MAKLAHIVNPVAVAKTSDLFIAQPIAFHSIKVAQAAAAEMGINVDLYSAQFPEDRDFAAQFFTPTPDLNRSVLDMGEFHIPRKLPLIQDILDRLYTIANDADYLIYTNADITLMPNFYSIVNELIQQGHDAFVINRRTISKQYSTVEELPRMYAEVGRSHPGHDCFVFKRSVYPKYQLDNVCIGITLVGVALLLNLICNAEKFREFRALHLTFHIGDDTQWRSTNYDDYTQHNLSCTVNIMTSYETQHLLADHPLIQTFADNQTLDYWTNRKNKTIKQLKLKVKNKINRWLS